MNFVKKLFGLGAKPIKATPKSPNKIKPDTLSTNELVAIANGDKQQDVDAKVLGEAINSLNYGEELLLVAKSEGNLQREALKRIAQCLEDGSASLRSLRQDLPNITQQLLVASYCSNEQFTASLLSELRNEDELLEICLNSPSTHLRSQLIERIQKTESLKKLEKTLRSSDKSNYKLVRARLDKIKQEAAEQESKQHAAESLIHELGAHAKRSVNKDYRFNAESLIRRHERLIEDLDEAQKVAAEKAIAVIQENITDSETTDAIEDKAIEASSPSEIITPSETEKTKAPAPEVDTSDARCTQILERYGNFGKCVFSMIALDDDHLTALNKGLSECQRNVNAVSDELSENNTKKIESLNTAFEQYLNLLNTEGSELRAHWNKVSALSKSPEDADFADTQDALNALDKASRNLRRDPNFKLHAGKTEFCELLTKNAQYKKKADQLAREAERNISGLIRKAGFAVDNGQLKRAQGIRFSIAELIEAQPRISAHIERQWEEIQEKVEKLSDWQSYAIIPKLEALVEKMTTLAEAPLEAEAQSTKIKHLQDEWKSITKGSAGKHQELWDSFKQQADIAYEVCKVHFEQLDIVRQENSDKRTALIQQLNDYISSYDWDNADWPQVEKLLRAAKNEWQSYSPSLRKSQRKEQDSFSTKVNDIQSRLDEEYTKNKTEKERLINSIEPLVQSEDLNQAINVAINFQKQWKTIGRCRHRDEDKLWKQFRAHCDAIFAKRDAERNAEREVLDTAIAEVTASLDTLEGLLNISDDDFEPAYRDIDNLKVDIESLENLPRSKQSALQQRQSKLLSKIESRFAALQQDKSRSGWQALFKLKETINLACTENDEEALESAKAAIAELSFKPGQSQNALQESLSQSSEQTTEPYQLLCIRAEILMDASSPESDKALRMQYQVGQLQAGLGSQSDTREQLAEEWFASPSIAQDAYLTLSQRFTQQLGF